MKIPYLLTLGLLGLVASAPAGAGQPAPTTPPAYVNENPSEPAPLHLREIEGSVRGLGGDAMSRAVVSLFTESDHALIATVMSDGKGNFRFEKMDKGLYRLVVRVEGLCSANIPLRIDSSLIAHHKVIITMRPKDIDTCSYGMAK